MKVLATLMLMVSLLAMSVAVASAEIARPPCSAQIRADDMCYAAALPGSQAETAKKPGLCFVCLAPGGGGAEPARPGFRVVTAFGAAVPADARGTCPWRPPQARSS
ncbi:hypothetical protein [Paracoccus sp. S3-43]|uniref:hypothetical protein n=1 Tax=Paracoccus sp. S3-43 TaxID=3030011 RepID=UPI0023AFEAFC|nr:hypothetical protein [Paracoccus sp. S3-43]WEF24103.1 hypothetical protein PXD02_15175 [Paracoccus sp. S3-43]